ncbi:hypothetical protein QJS04_geneDACA014669 [Acorus gramineus]|uniref:Uncharacterized protein n=1 Tax=Acorus gramineus TaxID=55184 RepID=A0AAV9B223_ACOGR|nr:hypothetical protein QJS04_geneDACA014669 [Acorus gramineus]
MNHTELELHNSDTRLLEWQKQRHASRGSLRILAQLNGMNKKSKTKGTRVYEGQSKLRMNFSTFDGIFKSDEGLMSFWSLE